MAAPMENRTENNHTPNVLLNLQITTFPIPAYILDDLCSRFIINIPEEERSDLIRIFFQIELAHWFYLDFYCQENIDLKACGIKEFSKQVFHHCPTLIQHADSADKILMSWREYKMAVPTYGAILLDPTFTQCLLVQGFWSRASWGFPKGKVNEGEAPHDCAIREVLEETGYNISGRIDVEEFIEFKMNEQLSRLYIVPGVSMDTKFQPRTRKEIKKVEWFQIDHLPAHKKDMMTKQHTGLNPNSFFMVIPFIKPLRRWISRKTGPNEDSDMSSGSSFRSGRSNRSRDKGGRERTRDGQTSREKQPHQHQLLAQCLQTDFRDYIKPKDARNKSSGHENQKLEVSPQPTKQKGGQNQRHHNPVSPRQSKKHEKHDKNQTQYHILKRDGTTSSGAGGGGSGGSSRKTLEYDEERSSAYKSGKRPSRKNQPFFSPSLANFKLDIDAVMTAMFPNSKSSANHC